MVTIRLVSVGKPGQTSFIMVASDSRTRLQGRWIEKLGYYNPNNKELKVHEEAVIKLLLNGAQTSTTTRHLLKGNGTLAKVHQIKMEMKKNHKLTQAKVK